MKFLSVRCQSFEVMLSCEHLGNFHKDSNSNHLLPLFHRLLILLIFLFVVYVPCLWIRPMFICWHPLIREIIFLFEDFVSLSTFLLHYNQHDEFHHTASTHHCKLLPPNIRLKYNPKKWYKEGVLRPLAS